MLLHQLLNEEQQCVLLASIIADGEITKIYKYSRRKNNSYREHFGINQLEYRMWKQAKLDEWLYFSKKGDVLVSRSHPLFTELYPVFYNLEGEKDIPFELIKECSSELFLTVLYMDDGSLCISKRINHKKKRIYLTPHVYLYLQAYQQKSLQLLQDFILANYSIVLNTSRRQDGSGYILKTTSTRETFSFLDKISIFSNTCPSMYYKTNWEFRLEKEKSLLYLKYPDYEVLTTSPERFKNYSKEEIEKIISMKRNGKTINEMAEAIGRTYWSVVYKVSELRKSGQLYSR